jgi:SNF2 family DNA or RNA helicase
MTFNTSENANVMIMAVQKAAYGIDLSSASRVYFCSPVWQTAMEQQAIKRAHRIGQTKPVFVETLVIRHSIEDALLKRRRLVTGKNQ